MCLCVQVIDIINEEEKQFLKTLGRGKRVFERTVENFASGTGVIPGTSVFPPPCCPCACM